MDRIAMAKMRYSYLRRATAVAAVARNKPLAPSLIFPLKNAHFAYHPPFNPKLENVPFALVY